MTVDKQRYEAAASRRKTDFIITAAIFAVFIAACVLVAVFMYDNIPALIIDAVCVVWFVYKLVKVIKERRPWELFAPEYEGKVVKITAVPPKKRHTGAPVKPMAELYIAKSATDVRLVAGISREAADCYRVGERVLLIGGTRLPVILEREPSVYPCPICGAVHTHRGDKKCPSCGA